MRLIIFLVVTTLFTISCGETDKKENSEKSPTKDKNNIDNFHSQDYQMKKQTNFTIVIIITITIINCFSYHSSKYVEV